MIERLKKDIEYQEVAINALRKVVNSEDQCDTAIKNELEKGPKRIRVISREELKIEIRKYKNMTLRLLEVLKQHGIKAPAGIKVDQSSNAAAGYKEEQALSQMDATGALEEEEKVDGQSLAEEKERLEEQLVKLNLEMKNKDEKILELLEEIEDHKVQVYSRNKAVELQQKQIEELLEELRECKAMDNDVKVLVSKKIAVE